MRRLIVVALLLPGLSERVAAQPLACQERAKPGVVAELYFGRNIGNRLGVSEAAFRRFLDKEVTPRFPDGLTVMDGKGQWRASAGAAITHEPSKILVIALPEGTAADPRLQAIAEAYKARFKQQSVLTIVRTACVGF